MKSILLEFREWIEFIVNNFPGNTGVIIRNIYYKNFFKGSFLKAKIQSGFVTECPRNISFGDNAYIGLNCKIFASHESKVSIGDGFECNTNVMTNARGLGEIKIGENVLIGPNVVLRSNNHNFSEISQPISKQGMKGGKIIIDNDVWIGSNVVILPNINIGRGSIIGAGAVVTSNVQSYSIVGGVPAKEIGKRN